VRAIGVSNFSVEQLDEAVAAGPVAALQNRYSLLEREAEADVLPRCAELGVGFVPYFPLASGLLTGKYRRGTAAPTGGRLSEPRYARRLEEAPWDTIEALESFATKRGVTALDVAIGGLAAQPAITSVIAGATKPEQVVANVAAGQWIPTDEDLAELRAIAS
jgi:aryl-alcohol dehydrogenase-like predicted oxidoreductase